MAAAILLNNHIAGAPLYLCQQRLISNRISASGNIQANRLTNTPSPGMPNSNNRLGAQHAPPASREGHTPALAMAVQLAF